MECAGSGELGKGKAEEEEEEGEEEGEADGVDAPNVARPRIILSRVVSGRCSG